MHRYPNPENKENSTLRGNIPLNSVQNPADQPFPIRYQRNAIFMHPGSFDKCPRRNMGPYPHSSIERTDSDELTAGRVWMFKWSGNPPVELVDTTCWSAFVRADVPPADSAEGGW